MHDRDEEQRWSRRVPKLVKLSCGYCVYVPGIKPETSEMQKTTTTTKKKKKAFPSHCKSEKILPRFPHFPWELWKGCYMQPESLWAVLKIDILGPGDRMTCKATQTRCNLDIQSCTMKNTLCRFSVHQNNHG